ncbi:transporter substrate-binding domain-containing protein [Phenylobacterium aquaticum]|uniref:transporter substrate-binding domain-containing protein n=1 Tax=Phenylobacterium aquaticum TaxID=1763816 RepID=UPI001F5D273D|nr:transporter substrate-binding domain-containing protein [Phenylobacterium aquaticum]MCI3132836.1 transporter substrate-binding domain-containing protein [Phenylobacterium aquaticum]
MRRLSLALAASLALAGCSPPGVPKSQGAVAKIQARGHLNCGGSQGIPGLSRPDEKGVWRGFDSDICRALAAAVLGDANKVQFTPLNAAQRLPAVQTGEIDALSRTSTITFTRDMAIRFVAVTLYDSDALIVRKSLGAKGPADLNGRTVCMQGGGSLVEGTLDEAEQDNKIKLTRVYFDSTITARDTFFAGRCDAYVTDGLAAKSQLATVAKTPDDYQLMYIGRLVEPNGVAIARGDDRWFDVVRWTINLLIWAEQNDITQANIDERVRTGSPEIKRVLGGDPKFGREIGLDPRWAYNVIKQVGNYREVWDRNLGDGTPIKAERRYNRLYTDGGLLFPMPWD